MDYAGFEGTIPEGQYGGGTVKIWDKGTYETMLKEDDKGTRGQGDKKRGAVWRIRLNGKRLVGEYTLVHTGERNWLLFKNKGKTQ